MGEGWKANRFPETGPAAAGGGGMVIRPPPGGVVSIPLIMKCCGS